MISQVIGAIIGSAILFALVSTGAHDGPTATGSNGLVMEKCCRHLLRKQYLLSYLYW